MSALKRLFVVTLVAAAAVRLLAAPVTVKLATQAPANTTWHKALTDMGEAWNKSTSGRVTLQVYAGGTQGDEPTTIRMMRPTIGTLQAALLTAGGLSQVDEAFNIFAIPFFFEADDEQIAVQQKLSPILEQKLEAKGFHLLCWGTGGWVELFSKKPLKTLGDVKSAKLYTSKGDDKMVQWYKANGFHPVAINATDVPAQLKLSAGMVDTAPFPPYPALLLQIFRDAKYMLDIRVAPLAGALVMSNDAWNKIDANDRAAVLAAAKTLEKKVLTDAPTQDSTSVATMAQRGLTVTKVDPAAAAAFHAEANKLTGSMRGNMVPADIYDAAVRERDAFRKMKK